MPCPTWAPSTPPSWPTRWRATTGRAAHETYFLTGTDEHGQKIERMAQELGASPKAYCDGIVAKFKQTWERMGVSYDRFIRTTDPDHHAAVEAMWQRISANGDIYLADYDAMYCVGCEGWKTEEDVVVEDGDKLCPSAPQAGGARARAELLLPPVKVRGQAARAL